MYESAISRTIQKNYSYTRSYSYKGAISCCYYLTLHIDVSDKWIRRLHLLVTTGFPFVSDKWILWFDWLVTTGFPDSSK